jgi:hypothetical protein
MASIRNFREMLFAKFLDVRDFWEFVLAHRLRWHGQPAHECLGLKIKKKGTLSMQNKQPGPLNRLFSRGEDMVAGALAHGDIIELKQNNAESIGEDLDAARALDNAFKAARTGKKNAFSAQRTANKEARTFIVKARDVLKPHLGAKPSELWVEAGFTSSSIKLPTSIPARIALLFTLKAYFTAHPTHQSGDMGVTATAALDQHAALSGARATVNACKTDAGTKKSERNKGVTKLRKRMRGLVKELAQLLPGDDARWNAFGLNKPDAVGLPDVPEGLIVVGGGPGHLLAKWDRSALGNRYRVYKKVVGVDNEFILVATVTDTE